MKFRWQITRSPWTFLALSFVAAIASGAAVSFYTSGVEERVIRSLDPVSVFVATQNILPGTPVDQALTKSMSKLTSYPSRAVPEGAIRDTNSIPKDLETVRTIRSGEILVASLFQPRNTGEGSLDIPDGLLATTVEVSNAAKVGAFLRPYDYVVVYLTSKSPLGNQKPTTTVLLSKALVLAIGDNSKRNSYTPSSPNSRTQIVTLGVTPTESLTLVSGLQSGSVYLGLLTPATNPFER